MIKLIASDMDGTFLDGEGSFDAQRFRRILEKLKQKGIPFVVASGRSYLALAELFADFHQDLIFLAENGSLVMEKNQVYYSTFMPRALYLDIVQTVMSSPYGSKERLLLSGKKASYILDDAAPDYVETCRHYYAKVEQVGDFSQIEDDIFKVTAELEADDVMQAASRLMQGLTRVSAVTTGFQSVDLIQSHVNKGTGLDGLCRRLGIRRDQVLAFGDNQNDIEMLDFAGLSVAPANAIDLVRNRVTEVIGSNEASAVLTYLEERL